MTDISLGGVGQPDPLMVALLLSVAGFFYTCRICWRFHIYSHPAALERWGEPSCAWGFGLQRLLRIQRSDQVESSRGEGVALVPDGLNSDSIPRRPHCSTRKPSQNLHGHSYRGGGISIILVTYMLRVLHIGWPLKIVLGAMIGAVAGLTGIGGGVYLAPLLLLAGVAKPKTTAAMTTTFILLNSLSGILARVPRLGALIPNYSLVLAVPMVVVAAQFSSYLGSRRLSQFNVRRAIGVVLITVGIYIAFTLI